MTTATIPRSDAPSDQGGAPPTRVVLHRRPLAVALLAGLLTTASVPPFGWWPAALVGLGLLPVALESAGTVRQRFLRSLAFAGGLYIPSLWWLTQFSLPGGLVICSIEMVITALVVSLTIPRARGERSLAFVCSVAAAVVIADALRSLWPFGGLPLGGIDLGQADGPFAALVTFGGRLLLIGTVALVGGAVVLSVRLLLHDTQILGARTGDTRTRDTRTGDTRIPASVIPASVIPASVIPAVIVVALGLTITALAHVMPDGTHAGRTLRLGVAQGSGPLGVRATDAGLERAFRAHVAATELIHQPVDLVLWPENVVDVQRFASSPKRAEIGRLAGRLGAPIVAGVVEDDPDPNRFRNFSIVVDPGGGIGDGKAGRYDKVRRVPFGEVVYFRSFLERFSSALPTKDMRSGSLPGVVATPFGPMALIISYEGFFDDRARSGVRAGGQALLIPTNASSFTSAHLPTQQIAAARLRARETGRWVGQAAPTGISAILTPGGRVVTRSSIQERTALIATITLRHGLTPYARWNDAPALALTAAVATAAFLTPRRRTRRRTRRAT